jgi:CDP-diacylglycerol--serine O-phosphatidyltransferase
VEDRKQRRMVPKPDWAVRFEAWLGARVPLHPNVISGVKLLVVTPALLLALKQIDVLATGVAVVGGLFFAFASLDYLDGVVARARGLDTAFGRVFDRVTDYPLLIGVSYFCVDVLPPVLLAVKIGIDLLLFALYLSGRGSTENRLRTAISYTTLLGLVFLSQGWLPRVLSPRVVGYLLWTNIAFGSTVAVYNLDVLQKRFIADLLSGANLLCGVFSILCASRGKLELSLLFLILGAAFDGFDGAAARRWGGTRFGMYSDDIADGVNYGVAPGAAIYFTVGGVEGVVVGSLFAIFTIARLVYFTLNKADADPRFFSGVPSTVGGLVVLCSLILFQNSILIVGLMVGVACILMVSFDTHYKHLGRALSDQKRRAIYGATGYLLLLIVGGKLWGRQVPVAMILGINLFYGLMPIGNNFRRVLSRRE